MLKLLFRCQWAGTNIQTTFPRRSQSMREVRKRDSASWERTRGEEKEVRREGRRGRRGKTPTPDYSKEEEERGRRNTKEGRSWWRKLLQLLGRKPKS